MRNMLYQPPAKAKVSKRGAYARASRRRALDPRRAQQLAQDTERFENEMTRGRRRGR